MDIPSGAADASLESFSTFVNSGGGTAVLEIHSAAFGALLATYNLPATPFGAAGAGSAGYRQIALLGVPIAGTGQAGAGAGTAAAKYRIKRENGSVAGEGNCGGVGSGQECILSNVNIANGQEVNLVSLIIRKAAAI